MYCCQLVFQWLTFIMIGYHLCSLRDTFSPVFFFTCFVLCVLWYSYHFYQSSWVCVLFCDLCTRTGTGTLLILIKENGILHPFHTFSNYETMNNFFITFFGFKMLRCTYHFTQSLNLLESIFYMFIYLERKKANSHCTSGHQRHVYYL